MVHFGLVVIRGVAAARELGIQLADGELDVFGGDAHVALFRKKCPKSLR